MKLSILALAVCGCLIAAAAAAAEEEYDYEEEPATPVVTSPPARSNPSRLGGLLSPRGRPNVARKTSPVATAQSTTAKAIERSAEVDEEEEGEDEAVDANQDQQEEAAPTTTTESAKKVRGGVRPFRSNQDLLAALKRRRAQAGPAAHRESAASTKVASESTTPKSKGTAPSRAKSNAAGDAKWSGRGRLAASRGKGQQEEVEETQRDEVQVKPKSYRRG